MSGPTYKVMVDACGHKLRATEREFVTESQALNFIAQLPAAKRILYSVERAHD